ncbi:MAG TPA: tRNA 4-thiouridine(8) synthase ThiI [Erysipelothrix sp.]|jgi:thiamine biosynthesis protein ThiI|nr:tRNA 4-thiouridine(8) synthase ThiI [Erysipelothrix sp.]
MIQDSFIVVRYGELSTKGKNRNIFVKKLKNNIQNALREYPNIKVTSNYNRTLIELNGHNGQEVMDVVEPIFGIASFSLGVKTTKDLDVIKQTTLELVKDTESKTFKVDTKRRDKQFGESSDNVNRQVAGELLRNTQLKVDVHNPDLLIKIEIEEKDEAYIMAKTIKGAGGYPVGVQGKALLLLSGGIDSPVAAHLANKRGLHLEAIHFESMPYTSQNALNKVMDLASQLAKAQVYMKVHIVSFTDIQMAIYDKADENYAITLMRRFMVRIAEKVAKSNKCGALVSGESLGQVASQTIESLDVINRATDSLILRPLITLDKNEIIEISKKIGTYETSILPFEDCCTIFTPVAPIIKPKLGRVKMYEERFDIEEMIDKAIDNIRTVEVRPKVDSLFD